MAVEMSRVMNERSNVFSLALLALLALLTSMVSMALPRPVAAGPPEEERKRVAERIGEQASRGIIQEGLETLDEAENQARLGRILDSPQMRDAVHDLSASFVLGVIDGMVDARSKGKTDVEIGKAIGKSIDRHLSPAVARMVARMLDSALDSALTDEHIGRVEALAEGATHAAIRGLAKGLEQDLGPALAATIEQDLGPALAASIEHDLGPALAATIEKDLGPALAATLERDILPALGRGLDTPEMQDVVANFTRSLAAEFVGGAGDAIDLEAAANKAAGTESSLQLFGNKVAFGYSVSLFVSFALGTMIIVLTVILFRNSRRLRKQSEAAAQREATLLNLIDNLETEQPELKADLRDLLEEQLDT